MLFLENQSQIIRKSNDLIEARYKLSLAEQRLVILLASAIYPDDEDFKDYELRVADFAKMFDLENCKAMYKEVEKSAKELIGRRINLSKNGKEIYTTWLSYMEYIEGAGVVRLRFDKSLKPYLLQLKSQFTQYQLNCVMAFKSQYSIRLYELLKMDAYKAKKGGFKKYFELQEFRELLGIEKKAYPVFADFRKYVIQPITSEVSNKTDLIVNDIKYGKTGRKITNITFFVSIRSEDEKKLQQASMQIDDIKTERGSDNHTIVDTLINLGFSLETAKSYKTKYGVKKIERNIAYTLAKQQEGKISDLAAYLNKAIELDYGGGSWELEQKKKQEAQKEQVRAEKERLAKKTKEEKADAERKAERQQTFDRFLALPEEQQIELRDQFLQVADSTTREKAYASIRKDEAFYKSPMVSSNFKIFLSSNKLV